MLLLFFDLMAVSMCIRFCSPLTDCTTFHGFYRTHLYPTDAKRIPISFRERQFNLYGRGRCEAGSTMLNCSAAINSYWHGVICKGNYSILCKFAKENPSDDTHSSFNGTNVLQKVVEMTTTLFPIWLVGGAIVGLYNPSLVTWLGTDLFTAGLGFIMLSMGLTLTFADFRRCLRNPWTVGVGFLSQYLIKPLLGFSIAMTMKLSAPLATGLILLSSCPGGQASSLATHIAKGNVALSLLMTMCSTIGAIVMTPLLTMLLAGQIVHVDAKGLAMSTFQVVMVPTVVGVLLNEFFPKVTSKMAIYTPILGVILTTLLCASTIGQVSPILKAEGAKLILPVIIFHAAAFLLGYWTSRIWFRESTSRTISIQSGMQSSALGFLLAKRHFTNPTVAIPSAVSVVCMAVGGSMLGVYWKFKPIPLTHDIHHFNT